MSGGTFPGAEPPARTREVTSSGVRLAVYEWGAEDAPPLLLAHGGFDFARTFDVFAPLLAAGGWRVVSWDHRGHGDSDHVALYSWEADSRDLIAVMDSISFEPMPVVGHSKGGALLLQIGEMYPHRVSRMVNIDGLPSPHPAPDVADHNWSRQFEAQIRSWLEHRRRIAGHARRPGTVDELAQRRGRMNPRLSPEWLRYLVSVGAREDDDGWRWKIDPALRFGGFGPWRSAWALRALPSLSVPVLGLLATEAEMMGWGTRPAQLEPYMPAGAALEPVDGAGHFIHIEQPEATADRTLDFLS